MEREREREGGGERERVRERGGRKEREIAVIPLELHINQIMTSTWGGVCASGPVSDLIQHTRQLLLLRVCLFR